MPIVAMDDSIGAACNTDSAGIPLPVTMKPKKAGRVITTTRYKLLHSYRINRRGDPNPEYQPFQGLPPLVGPFLMETRYERESTEQQASTANLELDTPSAP